jgi:hypothetical protein
MAARAAWAHSTGESFLALRADGGGSGTWDLAVRDLDDALVLDRNGDGHVTAGEVRARQAAIVGFARAHLDVASNAGTCAPTVTAFGLGHRPSGAYVTLQLRLGCPAGAAELFVDDRAFFDRDGLHRAFVTLQAEAGSETALLRADQTRAHFAWTGGAVRGAGVVAADFVRSGALHIWQGLDHVLFLIVLLLPAVLRREADGTWIPAPSLRAALGDVLRVVTAFTVAHSLTLGLAALGAVRASGRIVEPAIAASVVLAAVNNLRPIFGRDRWVVAFALGLLHGFGFSAVLAEVGLPSGQLLAALFGFNLGVELGQLALVALVVPLAFLARRTVAYRRLGLAAGSAIAGAVATVWLVERIAGTPFWG